MSAQVMIKALQMGVEIFAPLALVGCAVCKKLGNWLIDLQLVHHASNSGSNYGPAVLFPLTPLAYRLQLQRQAKAGLGLPNCVVVEHLHSRR